MTCLRLTFALALVAGITVLSAPGQLSPLQESAEVRGTRDHRKWSSTQETAEVHRAAVIPRDHYKTWSLFLICNPEWLSVEKSRSLYDLYRKFPSFGSAIGSDHVAVWFWKSERAEAEWAFKSRESANDTSLADNVDVDRSVAFCQKYQLRPTQGPHILITSKYPDEAAVTRSSR